MEPIIIENIQSEISLSILWAGPLLTLISFPFLWVFLKLKTPFSVFTALLVSYIVSVIFYLLLFPWQQVKLYANLDQTMKKDDVLKKLDKAGFYLEACDNVCTAKTGSIWVTVKFDNKKLIYKEIFFLP
jgi:hypothetical protein